jgi:hypothetical protein
MVSYKKGALAREVPRLYAFTGFGCTSLTCAANALLNDGSTFFGNSFPQTEQAFFPIVVIRCGGRLVLTILECYQSNHCRQSSKSRNPSGNNQNILPR